MLIFQPPHQIIRGRQISIYMDYLIENRISERVKKKSGNRPEIFGFTIPDFQRKEVWTIEQKEKFIESVFLGYHLGQIVYCNGESVWWTEWDHCLIDGQQRLSAIRDFIQGKFNVFGCSFDDIQNDRVRYPKSWYNYSSEKGPYQSKPFKHFTQASISVMEIDTTDTRLIKELYNRLNFGGCAHLESERA